MVLAWLCPLACPWRLSVPPWPALVFASSASFWPWFRSSPFLGPDPAAPVLPLIVQRLVISRSGCYGWGQTCRLFAAVCHRLLGAFGSGTSDRSSLTLSNVDFSPQFVIDYSACEHFLISWLIFNISVDWKVFGGFLLASSTSSVDGRFSACWLSFIYYRGVCGRALLQSSRTKGRPF